MADAGAGKTYRYDVKPDGSLENKRLFVESGSDGMTLDKKGNLYLTSGAVVVYSPEGQKIREISLDQQPTNVTFCGEDGGTLFITARSAVYTLRVEESKAKGSVKNMAKTNASR